MGPGPLWTRDKGRVLSDTKSRSRIGCVPGPSLPLGGDASPLYRKRKSCDLEIGIPMGPFPPSHPPSEGPTGGLEEEQGISITGQGGRVGGSTSFSVYAKPGLNQPARASSRSLDSTAGDRGGVDMP